MLGPAVEVKVTIAVFAVQVSPVVFAHVQAVPLPEMVIALAPIVSVRAFEFDETNDPHEHVCPLVSRVPFVRVKVLDDPGMVKLSCKTHLPPAPLKVVLGIG